MDTLLEYKCPSCGGAIRFDSTLQKMKCPYCDSEFDVETLLSCDADLDTAAEADMGWEEAGSTWRDGETDGMRIYVCNSCGGEIFADENTAATSCPFCGNPVVMKGKFSGSLKPDCIIPFKLDKEAAKAALRKHFEGKRLLPRVFKTENHLDEVKGIYVPFWLFDEEADASISYKAQKMRVWSDGNYNYTETSYYRLKRSGTVSFDHVPVDGSSKMADDLMESIEPFDFSEAVDFQTAYLAGYMADKYDVTAEESIARAKERIQRSTEEVFSDTITGVYSSVTPESSSVTLKGGKAKYAFYPVWILNTTWRGEKYTFAMNGQTGKFVGNLPVDKGLYLKWFSAITLIAGAVTYGIVWLTALM